MKKITVSILGMDCASCANTVKKAIESNEAVDSVNINVAAAQGVIEFNEDKISVDAILNSINESGYIANTQQVRFMVHDMECASCVASIQTSLDKTEGILETRVNFAAKLVVVTYNDQQISQSEIKKEIINLGYAPVLEDDEASRSESGESVEMKLYKKYVQRVTIAALLTLPVFILSMFMIEFRGHEWIQMILTTIVVFYAGSNFFTSAWNSMKTGAPNMDVLIAIGTSSAYLYSLASTIFPEWFMEAGQEPFLYYETAATIITLVLTGNLLEKRATAKTSDSLKALIGLKANKAIKVEDGNDIETDLTDIVKGDILRVKPGERVPLDGEIIQGTSSMDESMLTGESIPVEKSKGDTVFAGTLNEMGSLLIKVTKEERETTLHRIITLVKEAHSQKAPIQRLADRVSAVFVPTVLVIAAITFVTWMIVGSEEHAFRYAIMTSVAVMIIACPCAMGLAAPTAVMVGIGRGSENGILVKGGQVLESIAKATTVVFDKTGTLTTGELTVDRVIPLNGMADDELISLLASAELPSEHPIGKSIVKWAKSKNIQLYEPESFKAEAGVGISAQIMGKTITITAANPENKVKLTPSDQAKTILEQRIDGHSSALIVISDTIRNESASVIAMLKKRGVKTILLTGDKKEVAEMVSDKLGVDEVKAEVLPEQKAMVISDLKKQGEHIIMIGDGINDAPALAKADVGIAMGSGTDVAIESGDVVFMKPDLNYLRKVFSLSQHTILTIKQNLFWAFIYNILAIPIAAGVLYPVWGILLSPMIGAAAMAMSDVFVIGNSIRLKYKKMPGF